MTKYAQLIERMTIEQKATLLTATKGWNKITSGDTAISAFSPSEGKRGLRVAKNLSNYGAPTTVFPSTRNVARSFDTQLAASIADVVAKEAVALGVNTIPALFLYKEGKIVKNLVGYMKKDELKKKLGL